MNIVHLHSVTEKNTVLKWNMNAFSFVVLRFVSHALQHTTSVLHAGERWLQVSRHTQLARPSPHVRNVWLQASCTRFHRSSLQRRLAMSQALPPQPQSSFLPQLSQSALVQRAPSDRWIASPSLIAWQWKENETFGRQCKTDYSALQPPQTMRCDFAFWPQDVSCRPWN